MKLRYFLYWCCTLLTVVRAAEYIGTNHLTDAPSAFERAGAAQPIWWFAWGDAPFAAARAHQRPIVLWIGTSGAPGVQTIDNLLGTSEALAQLLNTTAIAVRVDAAARPDVAGRYGIAARAIGGGGTMPVLMVLTSSGDPIAAVPVAQTPQPVLTAEHLMTALRPALLAYRTSAASADATGARLRQQMGKYFLADWVGARLPDVGVVLQAIQEFVGNAWRVQRESTTDLRTVPMAFLRVCWWLGAATHNTAAIQTVREWMQQIAHGPWVDLVGGGVGVMSDGPTGPSFYKSTATNAQLLLLYADLYINTREPYLIDAAQHIERFAGTRLMHHGADWVRHHDVVAESVLRDWLHRATAALSVSDRQILRAVHGTMIGQLRDRTPVATRSLADVADWVGLPEATVRARYDAALLRVADARMAQQAADVDTTAYADDNGMLYAALFRAALVMDRPAWMARAQRGVEWWWAHAMDDGWGARHVGTWAQNDAYYLQDQVWWLAALMAQYEATGNALALERALRMAHWIEQRFADPGYGGFRDVAYREASAQRGLTDLPWRPFIDGASPAANPMLAIYFTRLATLVDDAHWRDLAGGIVYSVANVAQPLYRLFPTYAHALWQYNDPPRKIMITGSNNDVRTQALVLAAVMSGQPNIVLQRTARGEPQAQVCHQDQCSHPTDSVSVLLTLLQDAPVTQP